MKNSSIVIVDVETTGLSPKRHDLIELYALRIHPNGTTEEFSSLINPGTSIPRFITRLTGITDEMVEDAPDLKQVITKAAPFFRDSDIFVGHNVSFDFRFVNQAFMDVLGRQLENETLCTLRLARRLIPEMTSYKLMHLCDHLGIQQDTYHRAQADVHATKEVLSHLVERMKRLDIVQRDEVLKLQSTSISKIKRMIEERDNGL